MASRRDRLKKLIRLQGQVKAMHEMRNAQHRLAAAAAREEAAEIAARFDAPDSYAGLFPDLYNERIAKALSRGDDQDAKAAVEARNVTRAAMRGDIVERAYREVRALEERDDIEKEALEFIERGFGVRK